MARLRLSFACWDYDRIRPLVDGVVRPEGIELIWLNLPVEETFYRMMRHQEFDVAELSFASFLIAADRGRPRLAGIPVFPSRAFRHSGIYVHSGAQIRRPEDLRGKRVGIPEYQLTACVWIRGFLQHDYGVPPSSIRWFFGGEEQPGRVEKVPLQLPEDIRLEPIGPDQTLSGMLEAGELDALIAPRAPSSFLRGSPRVRRLFANYVEVEEEYYRRTGIFPIMHLVAVRQDVLAAHPWVAQNLYRAFVAAKEHLYASYHQTAALKVTLPWFVAEWERTRRLMGEDFWPYGLEANRTALDAIVQYAHEQGLIRRRLPVEELFAPGTLDEYRL